MHWIRYVAYPEFDCEDCIGMCDHGCYCQSNDSSAPGVGPTWPQRLALWILK